MILRNTDGAHVQCI